MRKIIHCFLLGLVMLSIVVSFDQTATAQSIFLDWCYETTLYSDTVPFAQPDDVLDNVMLSGLDGNQRIYGMAGIDTLLGGAGNDCIDGGEHVDTVMGDGENDLLVGGNDDDLLVGGDGFDLLIGGEGDDQLIGGVGADFYLYRLGDGNDTIDDCDSNMLIFDPEIEPYLEIGDVGQDRHYTITHPSAPAVITHLGYGNCNAQAEQYVAFCSTEVAWAGDGSGDHWIVSTGTITTEGDGSGDHWIVSTGQVTLNGDGSGDHWIVSEPAQFCGEAIPEVAQITLTETETVSQTTHLSLTLVTTNTHAVLFQLQYDIDQYQLDLEHGIETFLPTDSVLKIDPVGENTGLVDVMITAALSQTLPTGLIGTVKLTRMTSATIITTTSPVSLIVHAHTISDMIPLSVQAQNGLSAASNTRMIFAIVFGLCLLTSLSIGGQHIALQQRKSE